MSEKTKEMDPETHFKDTFRVFSKDEEGAFCALPTEASMSWKQHVQSKLIIFLLFSGYTLDHSYDTDLHFKDTKKSSLLL